MSVLEVSTVVLGCILPTAKYITEYQMGLVLPQYMYSDSIRYMQIRLVFRYGSYYL